jgi:hypothetical protein
MKPEEDIIDKLIDLHHQAKTDKSHFYVASCCNEAVEEIVKLRLEVLELKKKIMRSEI